MITSIVQRRFVSLATLNRKSLILRLVYMLVIDISGIKFLSQYTKYRRGRS